MEHFIHYRVKHMIIGLCDHECNRSRVQIHWKFNCGQYRFICQKGNEELLSDIHKQDAVGVMYL